MESKLYVGNLPYNVTQEELHELFSQAGGIREVSVITDRETGRSRGFAFVEMETQADANKAIEMFNDYDYQGRPLTVNIARPRTDRNGGGGGSRGGYGRGGGGGRGRYSY